MELLDFKILNTAIERLLNQKLAEFGITYTQATVIGYLKRNQGKEIFQKDIEYHLGLNHSTVSILLRRMEDKQMVKIQCLDSDRRYKKVSITAQALEISEQISVIIQEITTLLLQGISSERQQQISQTMKQMIQNIK